jgi:ATP-dependent RNA helicase RhlE
MLGIPQHTVETTDLTFSSLGLGPEIVQSLSRVGFEHPTAIQAAVIPIALSGKDLIGLSETGSGKTAAFCLPLAERVETGGGVRGLILCPTREIAMQTSSFLTVFGAGHGLRSVELIGGVKIEPQISKLHRGADLVVATPGRLLDHIRRGTIKVDEVKELVLDEADHMLDLGFLPQIREVLESLPEDRQTLMFSATMPTAIERLAQRFMKDAERVDLLPQGTAEGIEHRLYLVEDRDKKPCLQSLVAAEKGSVLVFLRRKVDADWACRQLELEGHPVRRIHSGLSQSQRDEALRGFREGEHRVLVATDVAARGIDVPLIQHIINFDPPQTVEDYIHRSGRTARGALTGTVSTIATWDAKPFLRQVEAALGEKLPRCVAEGVEPYVEGQPPKSPTRRRLR